MLMEDRPPGEQKGLGVRPTRGVLYVAAASVVASACSSPTTGGSGRTGASASGSGGATGDGGAQTVGSGTVATGTGGATSGSSVVGAGGSTGGAGTSGDTGTGGVASSGAGGDMGAGGSSGGTGGDGTGGMGTGPCGAPGLIFCDDFESYGVGTEPTGEPWVAPNCFDADRTLAVDGAQAHSGSQSLISARIGYDDCTLRADLGTLEDFYVRSWVRFGDGATFTAHELTFFELAPSASTDDPEIRIGFRGDSSCNPTGAEVTITGGGEVTGCSGFQYMANTWYCVEVHVVQSGQNATVELFIDGVEQSFNVHGAPVETLEWTSFTPAQYLKLGVRSYSGAVDWSVYNDDVAVGTQRIGCN